MSAVIVPLDQAREAKADGVFALRAAQRARDAYRDGGRAKAAVAAAEARLRNLGGGDAA